MSRVEKVSKINKRASLFIRHLRVVTKINLSFQPPIVVLNVFVVEADRLEAKDSNGYSDPYCMLGIRPGECSTPSIKSPRERSPNPGKHNSRGLG